MLVLYRNFLNYEQMKQRLLSISILISLFSSVYAQTNSYPFTNGSLTGLTRTGTALTQITDRVNSATNAISLNGDHLRTPTNSNASFSMSFWVKTTTNDANKRVIIEQSARVGGFDNTNEYGWYAYLLNGKVGLAANYWHTHDVNNVPVTSTSGYYYTGSTTSIADGYWHHVVVTAQKSTVYVNSWLKRYVYVIYVDGVLENSQTIDRGSGSSSSNINASLVPNAVAMTIGNNNASNLATTSRYFDGIDDIKYYNSVVNQTTVTNLSNENRCNTPSSVVSNSITSTSANIDWATNTDAVSWDLIYAISGQPMNTGTLISGILVSDYTITGLTHSTSYDVYIKSNCTGFSGWWTAPKLITTICPSAFANAIAQNISVQLNNMGSASITAASINSGSTVDCGAMTLSIDQTDFDCSDVGVNVVTLTVTDNQGHTSTATSNVTVVGLVNDENLTVTSANLCPGLSTTILTNSSSVGVTYTLKNAATNAVVGTSINGTGSALSFSTGAINSTQTFKVVGEKNPNMKYALDFDGTNDVVTTPITTTVTSTLSLEAWVYPRSTNYDRIISSYSNNTSTSGEVILDTYNATNNGRGLRFVVEGSGNVLSTVSTANVLTLNTWNHVAGTFDNGTLKIYVNGVLVGTATAGFTSIPTCTNVICLGEDPTILTAEYFNGKMDDVRIWTTARTEAQILANMNNCLTGTEIGLKSYFKISEGTGTIVTDLVAGSNGTMSGMDSATDWVTGQVDCGYSSCIFEMSDIVTVNVSDNTAPVPVVSSLTAITSQCSVTSLTAPTALDNCAGTITATHNATLPITSNSTIVWTYNDGNGNTSTQNQLVVLTDVTSPVPTNASLTAINSQCSITSLVAPTATDNCAGLITGTHNATFPITSSTVVTWTYTDGNSAPVTQTQSIVISDNIAPVATLGSLPTLNSQCAITSLTAPTATDNCVGLINGTHNATFPIASNMTITWTYSDGRGNSSTQTQLVVINDNIAPVKNVLNLISLSDQCQITSLIAPTATDNCAGTITGTHNVSLPITASTTITWSYNDGKGNISTQTQDVVINDNTLPVASVSSLSTVTGSCELTALVAPTALDNCAGLLTGTHTQTFPITANTTVVWTYDDGHGNVLTQNQLVEITNAAPVPNSSTLPDLTAQCSISTLVAPTATDLCSGVLSGDQTHTLPITSSTVIVWTFDDGDGNTTTQTQNVIINDDVEPVPTVAILPAITSNCNVTSLTNPTATDNCQGLITGMQNQTLPITGNTTIIWSYTDGNGNVTTQNQTVTISPVDVSVMVSGNTISAVNTTADSYQWVDCANGNTPVGANSASFTPTVDGNYAVEITVGNCTETSICTLIQGVGLNEIGKNGFVIYPNPVLDQVTIETEFEVSEVEIYSVAGELVLADKKKTLDVYFLAPGIYIVKVKTDKGVVQNRFVKN
jgi:hypothetical protein